MADITATPDQTQAAPQQAATPALGNGLVQPGAAVTAAPTQAAPPDPNAAFAAQLAPVESNISNATQKATALANQGIPPVAQGPHARLLNMIQGLAVGMDAFGKAIASHGKEGGVEEVQQVEQQKQEMALKQQQAAQQQLNFKVQQQLTIADTNRQTAQNMILLHTLPTDLTAKDVAIKSAKLGVIGQAQDIRTKALQDFTSTGDLDAYKATLNQLDAANAAAMAGTPAPTGAATGTTAATAGSTPAVPPIAVAQWRNATDAAISAYPNDAAIKNYADVLADPKATPQQMAMAATGAKNRMGALDAGVASQSKQEDAFANSAIGKLSSAEALAAPGAKEAILAKINDSKTDPADIVRLRALIPLAAKAQANKIALERQQKQMEQDLQNGDPAVVAAELVAGVAPPSMVLSARSMSKPFYTKVIEQANAQSMAKTGKPFNLAAAESQYSYAKNPQVQNTLNMIDTLNEPGGDFDILKTAADALPKMSNQTLNKLFNASATEFGSPEATNYHAALYNLATLEAQVQKGGVPDQTQIQDVLNQFKDSFAKGQLAGGFDIVQKDIAARKKAIVRNNPTLLSMYPDQPSANAALPGNDITTDTTDEFHQVGGKGRK